MLRTLAALAAACALLLSLALPARAAISEDQLLPIDEAFALSAQASERGRIEFTWAIAPGYYLYRHRMSVLPVDSGFKFNPLELPPGTKKTDQFFGEVETYRDSVTALLTGAAADGITTLTFDVRYQGCADVGVCYPPHRKQVTVTLPAALAAAGAAADPLASLGPGDADSASEALPAEQAFQFEAIARSANVVLMRFTPAPGYYLYRDRSSFRIVGDGARALPPQWPPAQTHHDDHFGDVLVYFQQVDVPLPLDREAGPETTLTLEATFQGCQTNGICYPPMTRQTQIALPAMTAAARLDENAAAADAPSVARSEISAAMALLLAVLGGLILNLMPCVLPVLSLKALGLAGSGESARQARKHALWYTAGVLLSFAAIGAGALALRAAGLALGWGFQLQQPAVVAALALVMFAIGLNLSGVFAIGNSATGAGQSLTQKSGAAGDFFTGVLAVVVATPCTAPFMGSALAFAFAASPAMAISVFLALGFGLALPFLLIGFVPTLARLLPRPGAWMDTLKQALAFPMYLTAVWLLWVLGKQRGVDAIGLALAGATVLGAGLWWWGRLGLERATAKRAVAIVLVVLGLSATWGVQQLPRPAAATTSADNAVPYSADRLQQLRDDGRAVFVNMTADWCVTCKANEQAVLSTAAFREALREHDVVYMKGDWTDVDPAITAFLESHGAVGVPLYVVYPAGGGDATVLPTVLTSEIAIGAISGAR